MLAVSKKLLSADLDETVMLFLLNIVFRVIIPANRGLEVYHLLEMKVNWSSCNDERGIGTGLTLDFRM